MAGFLRNSILLLVALWVVTACSSSRVNVADTDGGRSQGGAAGAAGADGGAGGGATGPYGVPVSCFKGLVGCSPVTNEPCLTESGFTCDRDDTSSLRCFEGENTLGAGDPCNSATAPFCGPTLGCDPVTSQCVPVCCGDDDCTEAATCVAEEPALGTLGFCRGS